MADRMADVHLQRIPVLGSRAYVGEDVAVPLEGRVNEGEDRAGINAGVVVIRRIGQGLIEGIQIAGVLDGSPCACQ